MKKSCNFRLEDDVRSIVDDQARAWMVKRTAAIERIVREYYLAGAIGHIPAMPEAARRRVVISDERVVSDPEAESSARTHRAVKKEERAGRKKG